MTFEPKPYDKIDWARWKVDAVYQATSGKGGNWERPKALAQMLRDERKRCAEIARNACLVPPDGGSPTAEEAELCNRIAEDILL